MVGGNMATTLSPPPARAPEPQVLTWTRAEFYRLAELGFFDGRRAELIEGQIMVMSPQNFAHACATDKTYKSLERVFGPTHWVRCQLPLALGLASDPEPDVSVVPGPRENYHDHPTT